jgi:hypothetical protein
MCILYNFNILWWSYCRLKILSTLKLSDTTPVLRTVAVLWSTSVRYFRCRIWSSHSVCYEVCCLLGYNFVDYFESQQTFQRSVSPQYLLAACFLLVSCIAYSSNLKTKVRASSETSVCFLRTTFHYIAEGRSSCFKASLQWLDRIVVKPKTKTYFPRLTCFTLYKNIFADRNLTGGHTCTQHSYRMDIFFKNEYGWTNCVKRKIMLLFFLTALEGQRTWHLHNCHTSNHDLRVALSRASTSRFLHKRASLKKSSVLINSDNGQSLWTRMK